MGTLFSAGMRTALVNRVTQNNRAMHDNIQRLSTGLRVVSARDDAAGLQVAEGIDATRLSLKAAERSTHNGISVAQIADGATGGVADALIRIRELAVQGSSETLHDDERAYLQDEYTQLLGEVDRVASQTQFNGVVLTDGSQTSLSVQVGSTPQARIDIALGDLRSNTLGVDALDLTSTAGAQAALGVVDTALDTTSSYRSGYGAVENRLLHAASHTDVQMLVMDEARSKIMDADLAFEASDLARRRVIGQASMVALGQAQELDRRATEGLLMSGLAAFR